MSWSHVNGTSVSGAGNITSLSVTLGWTAVATDLMCVGIGDYTSGTTSVSDSNSNTYTKAIDHANGIGADYAGIFSSIIGTGGASISVTYQSTVSSYPAFTVDEYTPPAGTVSVDSTATGGANNSSTVTGNLTITGSGPDLIYAAVQAGQAVTYTAGTSYTLRSHQPYTGGASEGVAAEDWLGVTTGPQTASMTLSAGCDWTMVAAAFKVTGGGGGGSSYIPPPFPGGFIVI
jgi:hypothetical protein